MTRITFILIVIMASTVEAMAQPPGGGRRGPGEFGGPGGGPPPEQRGQSGQSGADQSNAVMAALDADGDYVISAEEILNAAAALNKLDANRDGKLNSNEIRGTNGQSDGRQQAQAGNEQRGPGQRGPGQGGPGQGGPGQGGPPTAAGFMQHAATFDTNRDGVLNRAELERMAVAFVAEMTRQGPPNGGPGAGGRQQQGRGRGNR